MLLKDFYPDKETIVPSIEEKLKYDTLLNCTPDLPVLRYAGPQRVFLWDNMQDQRNMEQAGIRMPEDLRVLSFRAVTMKRFLPVKNGVSQSSDYKYMLPSMMDWRPLVEDFQSASITGQPLPVKGKVFSASLKAMQFFDEFYANTIVSQRTKINVRVVDSNQVWQCWAYLFPLSSICKYDPHKQKHRFGSTFDPVPVPTNMVDNELCYVAQYLEPVFAKAKETA